MTDKTLSIFNRWIRITMGLFFIGVAVYYKEWMPVLFGAIFIVQGIMNRGCHGECFTPTARRRKA